jgi:hypothetical protein
MAVAASRDALVGIDKSNLDGIYMDSTTGVNYSLHPNGMRWIDADGKTVLVSCETVAEPVAVRYAFAHNPYGANLYNKEGLPASGFRTDDW